MTWSSVVLARLAGRTRLSLLSPVIRPVIRRADNRKPGLRRA
ncbi:MAG TPA: hypothetical protein VEH31_13850 [Streptosporangiaceae bacterium]|nr:hypothetical protein [Streptosporangiaceae bacterium]